MKLTELRTNQVMMPLGFAVSPLSFSWKVTEEGQAKKQKWAQLRVFEEDALVYDSGKNEQADSLDWTGGGMDIKTVNGDLNQKGGVLYPGVSTIVAAEILGNYTQTSDGKIVYAGGLVGKALGTITESRNSAAVTGAALHASVIEAYLNGNS